MNRRARALVILLLILLVSGIGDSPGTAQSGLVPVAYSPFALRGYPPMPFGYGIQAHVIDDTQRVVNAVQDLGFGWIKQQVRWERVERSDGSYGWGDADRVADAASQAGIQVMSSVVAAPDWARSDDTGVGPPDDPQDLSDFMGDMAARYKGRVQAYETWNEQNSRGQLE